MSWIHGLCTMCWQRLTSDKVISIWDTFLDQQADMMTEACVRLTHNLTHDEWKQYLPDEVYRKTCPNLPEGE